MFQTLITKCSQVGKIADVETFYKQCKRNNVSKAPHVKQCPTGYLLTSKKFYVNAQGVALLERFSKGSVCVLTVVDVVCKLPIAVPTRDQKACTVARELVIKL